jgi:phosphate/sulfate permease
LQVIAAPFEQKRQRLEQMCQFQTPSSVAATPHQTINTHTLARIAMTWVTTLPGTMLLSFALGVGFFVAFD